MAVKKTIFVVDDHPIVSQGLGLMLEDHAKFKISGSAVSASEALEKIKIKQPDIMVVDISLQDGINGIELIKKISEQYPAILTLVLSMHDENVYAERALKAGAKGYIKKSEFTDKIIDALELITNKGIFLSKEMTNTIMHQITASQMNTDKIGIDNLTDREFEIFEMIGQGQNTKTIAERLVLSEKTVLSHKLRIKNKLKLKNANDLVNLAVKWFSLK
ncbi:MAG: response regulator transcription factor [Spirochaetes bacterium]|nr:response regulator transcription factor [Spirochaetota bacterium]